MRPLFKLGKRLEKCASYVRIGSVVADIGTDHGYLPIWLVKSNKSIYAYASDIAEKPLQYASNNAEKYETADKIETILAPGLEKIPENVTDIVIAGMGGQMIVDILSACPWIKDKEKNIILQPMKDEPLVRKWLYENGFEIKEESAVLDSGKIYIVIKAVYEGKKAEGSDISIYMGKLPINDESKEYAGKVIRILENKLIGYNNSPEKGELDRLKNVIVNIRRKYGG